MSETDGSAGRHGLEEVARAMRGSIGSLRAAAETLEKFPAMDAARRARLLAVISEEAARLGDLVERVERHGGGAVRPAAGATTTLGELSDALVRAAGKLGLAVEAADAPGSALAGVALGVPLAQSLAALTALLAELRREMAVARCRFGARATGRHLLLDLAWRPEPADLPRLLAWQAEALDAGPRGDGPAEPPSLRRLARDHDGEVWFILDRDGAGAHVRLLLPLAAAGGAGGG